MKIENNTKLIVESGATKASYLLYEGKIKIAQYQTIGISPLHQSSTEILTILRENVGLQAKVKDIKSVYFFGTGCFSTATCQKMEQMLGQFFVATSNENIQVKSDLWAAVLASCGKNSGICCILGTGANACYYDGTHIHQQTPALGYILGDEGSGSYLGKTLLRKFLYKQIPPHIHQALIHEYQIDRAKIINAVYRGKNPKRYLASFAQFLGTHQKDDFCHQLLLDAFGQFLDIHVCCYNNYQQIPIHFVGSIAHHFSPILQKAIRLRGMTLGKILPQAVEALSLFLI